MATRLSRYLDKGKDRGWDMDRWKEALKDTKDCQKEAIEKVDPIDRMVAFIDCRAKKRLPPKGIT